MTETAASSMALQASLVLLKPLLQPFSKRSCVSPATVVTVGSQRPNGQTRCPPA